MYVDRMEFVSRNDRPYTAASGDAETLERHGWLTLPVLMDLLAIIEVFIPLMTAVGAKFGYLDGYLRATTSLPAYVGQGLLVSVMTQFLFRQSDLYSPKALLASRTKFGRVLVCTTLSFLFLVAILYLLKVSEDFSRGWLLVWYSLTVLSFLTVRSIGHMYARLLIAEHRVSERIAVYGTAPASDEVIAQVLRMGPGFTLAGYFKDNTQDASTLEPRGEAAQNVHRPNDWRQYPVSGGLDQLIAIARDGKVDKIIVALPPTHIKLPEVISALEVLPTSILYCPEVRRLPIQAHGLESLGTLPLLLIQRSPLSDRGQFAKTALDYTLALIGIVLLSPLLLAIAAAIKLESKGPVFFRQKRHGYNDRVFGVLKFRTMNVTEDGPDIKQAVENDPRVTRVGSFLRKTSLDELPQLFTILTGEMSLVGPRPHAVAHGELYTRQLQKYATRHRVKPGITGWAQVNGYRGNTTDLEMMRKRVEYDTYYIENWSIWFDIEILLRTIFIVMRGTNAY